MGVAVVFDEPASRLGDNGGGVGRSLPSSTKTICDENDGPNVDSSASAEGSCDPAACAPQGDSGTLAFSVGRGLFVDDVDPDPMVADVDVESHSLDLAVLIPRLCLDPSVEPSESLGDGLSALMRLQSLEKMSDMLCLTPFQLRARAGARGSVPTGRG